MLATYPGYWGFISTAAEFFWGQGKKPENPDQASLFESQPPGFLGWLLDQDQDSCDVNGLA
jgi:hypothetical protein